MKDFSKEIFDNEPTIASVYSGGLIGEMLTRC